ncbi:MAG: AmmeMemoRadiSam system radical SAM enzyme [Euryarchaeota archaeon]|nr:AmmeMemoRadiSam system radical SAM enzyme [Euryarchaeota archaeon]
MQLLKLPTVRESQLYEKLNGKVKCSICERRCVIAEGGRGFCKTKTNIEGRLYTLVYGDISALESRPIEIKPFFHFYPGSTALTFSTWSCNFHCPWCQNWHLSRSEPKPEEANFISPERMIGTALKNKDEGLCVSFQEPTLLFEYSLDVFKIAREKRLYSCWVSNGYLTLEALRMLASAGMDAIKIDMKGDENVYKKYCGGLDVNVVWRNAREAKKLGMHVEIVNLVITDVNDDEACLNEIIQRHIKELGADTPLHFTRYYPAYKFSNPSTRIETLEKAYEVAKKAGVLYPYIGNMPGHRYENTYCPNCGELLIKKLGFSVLDYKIKDKKCPSCGEEIPIVGRHVRK